MNDHLQDGVNELLQECRKHGRVCPQPQKWQAFYEMLPDKSRVGVGWQPSVPLILDGWWYSTDEDKRQRLELHVRWAAERGSIKAVSQFLLTLLENEWYHEGD